MTYFGAALVALNRGHLGFDNIVRQLPAGLRALAFTVSESLTITFFLALAWGGVRLMHVISDERLMTVDWFPERRGAIGHSNRLRAFRNCRIGKPADGLE